MTDKKITGNKGESLAADYFTGNGYTVLARNYRSRRAEIDLIVRRGDWVLFVEVKTRSSWGYGEPEDAVDMGQVSRIFDAAEDWIFDNDWQGHIRFDIVSVKMGDDPVLEHFEDAIN